MQPAKISDLETVFSNLTVSLMALGGVVLFVTLLQGGFKYLNSGGDQKAIEVAQKTITYAIGGLMLLIGSYLIIKMIGQFTGLGTTITNFSITR